MKSFVQALGIALVLFTYGYVLSVHAEHSSVTTAKQQVVVTGSLDDSQKNGHADQQ